MHLSQYGELTFTPARQYPGGTVTNLLERSYRKVLEPHPEIWEQERLEWAGLDRLSQELQGDWIFLSRIGDALIGLASFDPRQSPKAIIGHNCIVPEHRGHGYGKRQIQELLRIITARGFQSVVVTTGDHPFFLPAQKMYLACGFKEVCRNVPPPRTYMCKEIQYELVLDNNRAVPTRSSQQI